MLTGKLESLKNAQVEPQYTTPYLCCGDCDIQRKTKYVLLDLGLSSEILCAGDRPVERLSCEGGGQVGRVGGEQDQGEEVEDPDQEPERIGLGLQRHLPERETGQKSVPCCMRAPTVCHTLLFRFHCVSNSSGCITQKLGLNHS